MRTSIDYMEEADHLAERAKSILENPSPIGPVDLSIARAQALADLATQYRLAAISERMPR